MNPHDEQLNSDNGEPKGRDEIADELLLASYSDELSGGRLSEEEERAIDEYREKMRTTLDYDERRRIFKEWHRKREREGRKRTEILGFCEAGAIALGRPELRDMYVRLEWVSNNPIWPAVEREFGENWLYSDEFDFERTEGLMEAGVLDADGMHWHPEPQEPNPPVTDPRISVAIVQAFEAIKARIAADFGTGVDGPEWSEVDMALKAAPPEAIEEMRGRPHSARLLRKYLRALSINVYNPEKLAEAERWLDAWFENR